LSDNNTENDVRGRGLVLTRKLEQAVVITVRDIEVRVVVNKIESNQISLRFIAPKDHVRIDRAEIAEKRKAGTPQ